MFIVSHHAASRVIDIVCVCVYIFVSRSRYAQTLTFIHLNIEIHCQKPFRYILYSRILWSVLCYFTFLIFSIIPSILSVIFILLFFNIMTISMALDRIVCDKFYGWWQCRICIVVNGFLCVTKLKNHNPCVCITELNSANLYFILFIYKVLHRFLLWRSIERDIQMDAYFNRKNSTHKHVKLV